MSNIIISPQSGILEFNTGAASGSAFDGSLSGAARLKFESSGVLGLTSLGTGVTDKFTIDGSNGRLFTVNNTVTGSIFSVNDVAGLPIVEVFSDDRVVMGQYATDALVVSGSGVSFATAPTVNGNPVMTGVNPYDEDTLQTVTDRGATTTNNIEIQGAGTKSLTVDSTDGHASVIIDRHSSSYDANLMFQTNGATHWRLWNDSNDSTLSIRDEANASNVMTWEVGGNIGIGIDDPTARLELKAGTSDNSANAFIAKNSSSTSLFSIRNDGRVDIPVGPVNIGNNLYLDNNEIWAQNSANLNVKAAGDVKIQPNDGAATAATFKSDGKVGIGTTGPAALLSVGGGNSAPSLGGGTILTADMTQGAGNYASIAILAGNAGRSSLFFGDSDAEQRGAFDYRHADDSLSISTAASEVMRIDGGVRIGTSTQKGIGGNEIFTISGGGASIPSQTWTNAHSSALYLRNYNNAAGEWQLQTYNGGNGGVIQLVPYGGNVTIGNLTASAKLDIKTDNGNAIRCESATGGHFIVAHGGKVGIQTHNPTYALHIDNNGNLNPANVLIDSTTLHDSSISFSHNGTFGYTIGSDETDRFFKISSGSALGTNDRLTVNGVGLKVEGIVQADVFNTKANDGNIIYRSDSRTFVGNAGSNGLIVLDNGDVGIGRTDPNRDLSIVGQIGIDNSASSPSAGMLIAPDGTSNKIYSRTANNIATPHPLDFYAGSAHTLRIASNGNVGIGTNNPAYKLDVIDSDGGTLARFKDSDSSHAGLLIQGDVNGASITNAAAFSKEVIYLQNSANAMRFYTDGTEAVRIDSSQRVGIGTNSVNGFTHINGRMLVEGPTVPSTLAISDSGDASKNLRLGYEPTWDVGSISASDFGAGWKNIVIAPIAGKVGIGTTAPHQALSVKGTIVSYNNSYVQVAGMTNSSNHGRLYANNSAGVTNVLLDTNGVSYFNGGSVGIGVADPDATLEVKGAGNSNASMSFVVRDSDDAVLLKARNDGVVTVEHGYFYVSASAGAYVQNNLRVRGSLFNDQGTLQIGNSSGTAFDGDVNFDSNTLFVDSSTDRIGIGTTTPDALLHVYSAGNGEIEVERNGGALINLQAQASKGVVGTDSNHQLDLKTNGGARMTLLTNGDVGIGTTAPLDMLHIVGSVRADLKLEGGFQGSATDVGKFQYAYTPRGGDVNNRNIASISAYNTTTDSTAGGYLSITTRATNSTMQERIRVNQDGQVDIYGNASFASYLYHKGDEDTNIKFNTDDVMINVGGATFFRATETTQNTIKLNSDSTDSDFYLYSTSSTPAIFMRGSDGQVGIGTNNPTELLEVDGNIRLGDGGARDIIGPTNESLRILANPNASTEGIIFSTDGGTTTEMFIKDGGNVGIGTTNPVTKLEVQDSAGGPMLQLRPNAASTDLNPIILYRSQLDGSANYMLCEGTSTYFGTYHGGVPSDKSEMIRILPNSSDSPSLRIGDAGSTAANLQVGGNIKLLNNGASYINGGDVGIGTATPAQKLHLEFSNTDTSFAGGVGGSWGSEGLLIENTSSTADTMAIIQLRNNDADIHIAGIRQGTDDNDLGFFFEAQEKVRFTHDGSVGIGITNPSAELHVDGDVIIDTDTTNKALYVTRLGNTNESLKINVDDANAIFEVIQDENTAAYGNFHFKTDVNDSTTYYRYDIGGSEQMRITSSGLGIKTTQPEKELHVVGDILIDAGDVNTNTGELAFTTQYNTAFLRSSYTDPSASTETYLAFHANTAGAANGTVAEQMRIAGSNVGIGTAAPVGKLAVAGTINALGGTIAGQASESDTTDASMVLEDNDYIYGRHASNYLRRIIGRSSTAVEIGHAGTSLYQQAKFFAGSAAESKYSFHQASNELVRITCKSDSTARVGIGSVDPAEALDVVGLIRFGHTRADNAQKIARLLVPEYNNSHGQFLAFMGTANQTSNAVSFGGGTSSADAATTLLFYTASAVDTTVGTERMRITSAGNVGIGVSSDPSSKLHVNGELTASTKTFDIEHPTQSGKRLIHGCFEGPEHGVYFRGKTQDSGIQAPEYWSGLVDIDSMTVDVTPIGANQSIYVDRIEDNGDVYVGANTEVPLNYFYIVYGERKDIDNLVTVKDAPVASPSDHID